MQITIPYTPQPYQVEMHKDSTRFRFIVGGRRAGKSVSCFQEILRHCLSTPQALAWWVAPTYSEAREIGYEEFLAYFEVLKPAVKNVHHSIMRVEFKNGSKLYFKGADRQDSLRGRGLTFLVIDEAAFIPEDVWRKVLRPALSDKKGRAILISTPNGKNWFYQQYQRSNPPSRVSWNCYSWPSEVNQFMTEDEIQSAREDLSDNDFRQEYLAEFITKAGQVYDDFSDKNIIDSFTVDLLQQDIYLGMDFGYANPSAICFLAVDRTTEEVYLFDEIYKERLAMPELQNLIEEKLRSYGIENRFVKAIYTDPAGNADELTSGISPVDYLRKTFTVINKGSKIAPGLTLVRSFIRNANGRAKLFVLNTCKETIRSLEGYTYGFKKTTEEINEEPLKDGVNDHMCDALRYFFVNRFDAAKYVANTPNTLSYLKKPKQGIILKRCISCRAPFASRTPRDMPPFKCKECSE